MIINLFIYYYTVFLSKCGMLSRMFHRMCGPAVVAKVNISRSAYCYITPG